MDTFEPPPGQQLVAPGKWPSMGERSPRPEDGSWRIHVGGAVTRPTTLSLAELRALPQVERVVDIHCVTRWSRLGVRFAGVPLAALVEIAVPNADARFVSFVSRSTRGHSTSLVLDDALRLGALVAMDADGTPLAEERGGPVRVVVPKRYFYKSLKWLDRIELLAVDRPGYWEGTAGYHNTADPWLEQRYVAPGISKTEAREILAGGDVSGRDLRSLDARGLDLSGLVARGTLLRDADLRGCRLQGACFDGANLTNAHLQDADFRNASLSGADLEGANFAGADLRGACLLDCSLLGASFCEPGPATGETKRGALVDQRTEFTRASLDHLTPEQEAFLHGALVRAGATL